MRHRKCQHGQHNNNINNNRKQMSPFPNWKVVVMSNKGQRSNCQTSNKVNLTVQLKTILFEFQKLCLSLKLYNGFSIKFNFTTVRLINVLLYYRLSIGPLTFHSADRCFDYFWFPVGWKMASKGQLNDEVS